MNHAKREKKRNEKKGAACTLTIIGLGRTSPSVNLHNGIPNKYADWSLLKLLRKTWPIFIVLVLDFLLLFLLFSTTGFLAEFLQGGKKKPSISILRRVPKVTTTRVRLTLI